MQIGPYLPLFEFEVQHTFFADGCCANVLKWVLTPKSLVLLQRSGFLARTTDTGVAVLADSVRSDALSMIAQDAEEPFSLTWLAYATDPLFGNYTEGLTYLPEGLPVFDSDSAVADGTTGRWRLQRDAYVSAADALPLDDETVEQALSAQHVPPLFIVTLRLGAMGAPATTPARPLAAKATAPEAAPPQTTPAQLPAEKATPSEATPPETMAFKATDPKTTAPTAGAAEAPAPRTPTPAVVAAAAPAPRTPTPAVVAAAVPAPRAPTPAFVAADAPAPETAAPQWPPEPKRYVLRFATRAAVWKYWLIGDWRDAEPQVVDPEGQAAFLQAQDATLPDGRPALTIRSAAPIAIFRRSPFRFQLRGRTGNTERLLVKRLPVAGTAHLVREPRAQGGSLVSEIYVHR